MKKAITKILVKIFNKPKIFRCHIWTACDNSINFCFKEIIVSIKNYFVDEIIDRNTDELITEILYLIFDQKIINRMTLFIRYYKLLSHKKIIHEYEKTKGLWKQNNTYVLPIDDEYLDVTDFVNEQRHCKVYFKNCTR